MLLNKVQGQRSDWEYPFAVAGINISFMLIQMLDLQSSNTPCPLNVYLYCNCIVPNSCSLCSTICAAVPSSKPGIRFVALLEQDENAFDHLYCVAFRMLDAQWLVKRASYMEFNVSFLARHLVS
jgi:hypothetical protein